MFDSSQGMVSRSEFLAAQSEAKANRDDAEARARDLLALEDQLSKTQEKLLSVRADTAQLQLDIGGTVSKSELHAAKTESENLRGTIAEMQGKVTSLEKERSVLLGKIQVHACDLIHLGPPFQYDFVVFTTKVAPFR